MHPRYLKKYTEELCNLLESEESVEKNVYACSQHVLLRQLNRSVMPQHS